MKRQLLCLCIAAASCLTQGVSAQSYPSKPVRVIVPWSAGSGTDLMARALVPKLTEVLGQQVVIDNRGGAGGIIGTEIAAKAAPDGYTILVGGFASMAISPVMYPKSRVNFDPIKDFAPVSQVSVFYNALCVHPSLPVKSVKELITLAKARPGELLMGSAGIGSTSHLAGELFKKLAHVNIIHVPYKSGAQLVVAELSGESPMAFLLLPTSIIHVKNGKLRMLGVTSQKRLSAVPNTPTIAETVPGFEFSGWQGILVPAGTSQAIITRLHAAVLKASNSQEFKDYLTREGSELVNNTPNEYAAFIRAELARTAELIKMSGAKVE